jgi:hypothetical protein
MTAAVASRHEDLTLELQRLVLVRALSSSGAARTSRSPSAASVPGGVPAELERVGG